VVRELAEVLVDPVIGVPGTRTHSEIGLEILDHAAECGLERRVGCGRNSQALADPRRQGHIAVVVDHEAHQRWSFVTMSFKSGQADFADGEGVEVGQEQFAIAQIEPRCLDRTGDERALLVEVVPVMRGVAGAVGEYQCALSAPSRASRSLGVVGGIRRGVPLVYDAEAADIDAQLHGWGTE
jgi:hypothetical protein